MRYVIRNLIGMLRRNIPPGLRKLYKFIIVLIRRIIGYYFLPVWFYSIRESEGSELFSFVHIGWDGKLRKYWLNRFSDDNKIIPGIRMIVIRRIPAFLRKNEGKIDIAIIESNNKTLSGLYPNSFLLPRWMEMELDIESFLKKSVIKKITRNIKKYELKYKVCKGIEEFEFFYHRMYKPQVLKNHENYAQLANYNKYSGKYLKGEGELFFLTKNNEPVAAAFVELNNGRYRLSISGVKDGSDDILKMGVVGALRYFIMHYYYESGIDRLLIGVSMPIVFDGVTEFKMRLGAIPYLKDLEGRNKFYFMPFNVKHLTARILKSNPLFHISGNGLNIAMFVSAEDYQTRDEFLKFFNRVKTRNVDKTRVYYFDNPGNIIQWLKEEDITCIGFNKYEINRITSRIN